MKSILLQITNHDDKAIEVIAKGFEERLALRDLCKLIGFPMEPQFSIGETVTIPPQTMGQAMVSLDLRGYGTPEAHEALVFRRTPADAGAKITEIAESAAACAVACLAPQVEPAALVMGDKTFTDISLEGQRVYDYPGGDQVVIEAPAWLHVSSRDSHRIIDKSGRSHWIAPGFLHISWKSPAGSEFIK